MKKLMMIAAITAATFPCLADDVSDIKEAQVYDIKVTVKTTVAKSGKLSSKKNPFFDGDGSSKVVYRAQGSQSWTGVLWGCGCETLLGTWMTMGDSSEVVAGVVIWNSKKPYNIVLLDDLDWHVLNAFDATGGKVEGAWTIGESTSGSDAFLAFAGFGTLGKSGNPENCQSYIKTLSGSVSGWTPAPEMVTAGNSGKCYFCEGVVGATDESIDPAVAWSFCPCAEIGNSDFTAVSGTWSLKYNKALSVKLKTSSSILEVYKKFPDTVRSAVAKKIAEVNNTDSGDESESE